MVSKNQIAEMYRQIYTIREFEARCIKLYRSGDIRGYFHPYTGEEAVAVGVCSALREDDYITSTHRGHGHFIAKGAQLDRMVAELFGKETGYCGGMGGSMHISDISLGNLGANGIVGGGISHGVGAALGASIRGEDRVAVVFCSDGATNNGVFSESLNLAAIWNLPVIIVIENNHYAVSTPIEKMSRSGNLYQRAEGYGVEASKVDGNDVLSVYAKTKSAVELCRCGKGPIVIEADTYRHAGHHVNDPGTYMPTDVLNEYKQRDPVIIAEKYFLERGGTQTEINAINSEIDSELNSAIDFAITSPEPSLENFLQIVELS